jgi:dihydroflavonol-4-reductase
VVPLVLGSAGFIGVNLVDALLDAGLQPRCGHRQRAHPLVLRKRTPSSVYADLDQPQTLDDAMRGCDTVFHVAGHYPRNSLDPGRTLSVGTRQTSAVLDAAARAGVTRFVYVSSTATVAPRAGGPSTEVDLYARRPGHGLYHDLKWEMEQRVLAEDRFPVVVACPAGCLGPWDLRAGTSALLVALARGLAVPHPDGVVNLVDVRDVAEALLRLARVVDPPRRTLLSAHSTRLHPFLEDLARRYRVAPPAAALSAGEAAGLADAEEARAAAEKGGRARLVREIVDLITHGVPVDATASREALGLSYRPLSHTLDDFDRWARALKIIPTLTT